MPTWKIHDKWANTLGISKDICKEINKFIDFDCSKDEEYRNFLIQRMKKNCNEKTLENIRKYVKNGVMKDPFGHDVGRRHKGLGSAEFEYLRNKSIDHVKAWYLHHALDHLHDSGPYQHFNEFNDRFASKFKEELRGSVYNEIMEFVFTNFDTIQMDFPNECKNN